jgi:hypothetical protein
LTALRHMEFLVIHYLPSATNSKHLDVGVIVFEKTNDAVTYTAARFIPDMDAVLAIDPDADIDMLRSCFRDFENKLLDPSDREEFIRTMRDTFSNVLQISDPKAVLVSATPERDIDNLASLYLSHNRTK